MNILVTGAKGFIGRNLCLALRRMEFAEVIEYDLDIPMLVFKEAVNSADIVFHLAGTNRPQRDEEYEVGNVDSLNKLVAGLERSHRRPVIVLSSSAQVLLDNPYGTSKRHAEQLLLDFAAQTGSPVRIFRLPGVFGKWCRPDYNSVIATFCYNISRDLPIQISEPTREIDVVHVDDVVEAFIKLIGDKVEGASFVDVSPVFRIRLGDLASTLRAFKMTRESLGLADLSDPFLKRLYATYISYLPSDGFSYSVKVNSDSRGVLIELLKTNGFGQVFVSRTKPGVTRGNHYHNLKVEKVVVLDGDAAIRFRHMSTDEIVEHSVSGKQLRIVDIPPGWTHSIENVGSSDMIVLFWSSEVFDPARPDTYAAEVLK